MGAMRAWGAALVGLVVVGALAVPAGATSVATRGS